MKIEEGIVCTISTKSELFAAKITSCSRKDYFANGLRSTARKNYSLSMFRVPASKHGGFLFFMICFVEYGPEKYQKFLHNRAY